MKTSPQAIFALSTILLVVSLTALTIGCGSTHEGVGGESDTITVKGNLTDENHKVIALYGDGRYAVSSVSDLRFSIDIETGSPVGLVLLGADDSYLGHVSLGNGIDSVPLTKLASGVSEIDLQTLVLSGSIVTASHNPLGSEIPLTFEEQTAIAEMDDLFAAIAKNPDIDGNGTLDFLEGKFFSLQILYFVRGGSFGGDLSPQVNTSADVLGYRLALYAMDSDRPEAVTFTGPMESGLESSPSDQSNVDSDTTEYFSRYVDNPSIPSAGQYGVSYKTSTLRFDIPDQSSVTSNVVVAIPTVTLNTDGTIHKVNWAYQIASGGTASLDPESVIRNIELQISGSGPAAASYPQENRLYNSGPLSRVVEHVLTYQKLSWSDVADMNMVYDDVYGNHIVVTWIK